MEHRPDRLLLVAANGTQRLGGDTGTKKNHVQDWPAEQVIELARQRRTEHIRAWWQKRRTRV